MKIVIASGTYPPQIGGMATFVRRFAELLHQSGIEVAVVAYGGKNENYHAPYLVRIVSRKGPALIRYWRYFSAILGLRRQADILYAQDLVSSGLPSALASLVLRKKLVLRLGGDFLWEKMVEEGRTKAPLWDYYRQKKSPRERIYLKIYRFVLGQAKIVIFNNVHQAKLYTNLFPNHIGLSKVVLNPWTLRANLQTVNRGGDIVYAGRFIKLKNLDLLIRAYSRLKTSKKLILIGEGPQAGNLKRLINQLKIEGRVVILKPLQGPKLLDFMSRSYLVILPSLTELNPNVVLEALSVGAPVLVTKEIGLAEDLQKQLVVFDPRSEEDLLDNLKTLLDEKKYNDYLQQIRSLKFDQTWEEVLEQHLQTFKSLL